MPWSKISEQAHQEEARRSQTLFNTDQGELASTPIPKQRKARKTQCEYSGFTLYLLSSRARTSTRTAAPRSISSENAILSTKLTPTSKRAGVLQHRTSMAAKSWFFDPDHRVCRELFETVEAKRNCEHTNNALAVSGKSGSERRRFAIG